MGMVENMLEDVGMVVRWFFDEGLYDDLGRVCLYFGWMVLINVEF